MGWFEDWFAFMSKWEGGYGFHPQDRGGATNRGVTLATWNDFAAQNGWAVGIDGLKAMTEAQRRVIALAIARMARAHLVKHPSVAVALADYQWHGGRYNTRFPLPSVAQLNAMSESEAFRKVLTSRRKWVRSLDNYATFKNGWENRLNDLESKFGGGGNDTLKTVAIVGTLLVGAGLLWMFSSPSVSKPQPEPSVSETVKPIP